MFARAVNEDEVCPVKSFFGRTLNMFWFVDAIELSIREGNLNALRMYIRLKGW